ncbi:unnamed protein product, partial [Rotaria magnacalcarata]
YTTLECNFGLLCLDWRDICDGAQQCMSGLDENKCDKLEFNECENDEYRCMNGMCIPEEYFLDGEFDCLDWSDEIQYYDDGNSPIEEASKKRVLSVMIEFVHEINGHVVMGNVLLIDYNFRI